MTEHVIIGLLLAYATFLWFQYRSLKRQLQRREYDPSISANVRASQVSREEEK